MEVDADIPEEACMIEADRKQLGRVIANLLINAVRHNPPGTGICVSVSRRPGIAGSSSPLPAEILPGVPGAAAAWACP